MHGGLCGPQPCVAANYHGGWAVVAAGCHAVAHEKTDRAIADVIAASAASRSDSTIVRAALLLPVCTVYAVDLKAKGEELIS